MISTAEVIRRIVASPAPVLLSDTCALLDLMRDPTRERFTGTHVEAALRLLAHAEANPRTLWLPLTEQVVTEFREHQKAIQQGAESAIQKLEELVHRVQGIMTAYGLQTTAPGLVGASLPATASAVTNRFIAASLPVRTPRNIERKAMARIAANGAPSQKGQQAKDCLILESYLHLARELRANGIPAPIVFLTTNTRDYSGQGSSAVLHPTLFAEFSVSNIGYAVNFGMAEQLLR
jgi:hypothetical protein